MEIFLFSTQQVLSKQMNKIMTKVSLKNHEIHDLELQVPVKHTFDELKKKRQVEAYSTIVCSVRRECLFSYQGVVNSSPLLGI